MRALAFLSLLLFSCTLVKQDIFSDFEEDNSTLTISDGADLFYLKRCNVKKMHDSLTIHFTDTVKHSNWYELDIVEVNNHFISIFNNTFSITDSSYKKPIFKTYYQSIQLDKSKYKKGDSITGTINLNISAHYSWTHIFKDTLKISGDFRAIVM